MALGSSRVKKGAAERVTRKFHVLKEVQPDNAASSERTTDPLALSPSLPDSTGSTSDHSRCYASISLALLCRGEGCSGVWCNEPCSPTGRPRIWRWCFQPTQIVTVQRLTGYLAGQDDLASPKGTYTSYRSRFGRVIPPCVNRCEQVGRRPVVRPRVGRRPPA